MQCVVLAGGLATRMRPITESIPKSLIPIGDKPFVHYQMDDLVRQGMKSVIFCVGYRGEMIQQYVGNGERWGIEVKYTDEKKELRGTGGALRLALDDGVLDDQFFVIYGDSFLPIDFREVWTSFEKRKIPALMTVLKNGEKWDKSNAVFKGDRISLYDKNITPKPADMIFIDYGLSVMRKEVVEKGIPRFQKYDLADLFRKLSLEGQLAGFEVKARFYEIGSYQGLEDFKNYLLHVGRV